VQLLLADILQAVLQGSDKFRRLLLRIPSALAFDHHQAS
jgi:hypothetical protein